MYDGYLLFYFFKALKVIPFPDPAIVGGKGLTHGRPVRICPVPPVYNNDIFSFPGVPRIKPSNIVFKRSDLWVLQGRIRRVCVINTPQFGIGIKEAKCERLEILPVSLCVKRFNISGALQDL